MYFSLHGFCFFQLFPIYRMLMFLSYDYIVQYSHRYNLHLYSFYAVILQTASLEGVATSVHQSLPYLQSTEVQTEITTTSTQEVLFLHNGPSSHHSATSSLQHSPSLSIAQPTPSMITMQRPAGSTDGGELNYTGAIAGVATVVLVLVVTFTVVSAGVIGCLVFKRKGRIPVTKCRGECRSTEWV